MAITQISRIQHRRGISTELPQLSSAEFGWSVDTRQLYIGNGTLDEGAPTVGNTEILTEYSDLLSIAQAYTLKGEEAGYTIQTNESASAPVSRSLQNKLDDFINVRDFGAVGDGVTDDTAAINWALSQVYCITPAEPRVRRTVYFPAGNYYIAGDVIKVPPYARLQGDGAERTFIKQNDNTQDCVLKLTDSLQQVDAQIGANGATAPQWIDINDISIVNLTDNDSVWVRSATNVKFNRVNFTGALTNVSTLGNNHTCVRLLTGGGLPTNNVQFNSCKFSKSTYAIRSGSDANITNILVSGSAFETLHVGVSLADGAATGDEPKGVRLIANEFVSVYSEAVDTRTTKNVISAYNYYRDVGNTMLGTGFPNAKVIVFGGNDCYSIGDEFDRTDADDLLFARIDTGGTLSYTVIPHVGITHGLRITTPGDSEGISDGTTANTSVTLTSGIPGATVNYTITRGSIVRTGVITITHYNGTYGFTDDYVENADAGVTFSIQTSGSSATLRYTAASTGTGATFNRTIEWHQFV